MGCGGSKAAAAEPAHAVVPAQAKSTQSKSTQSSVLSVLVDATVVVSSFKDLNHEIYVLCDTVAGSIAGGDPLSFTTISDVLRETAFPDLENAICFSLIELINRTIHSRIFLPFHPGADVSLNNRLRQDFIEKSTIRESIVSKQSH
jgi:hypothetical protein